MEPTVSSSNTTHKSEASRVDRIAGAAHTAVDKSASALAQGEHALRGAQETAGAIATEAADQIHRYSDQSLSDIKHYISEHPAKSLGIAIAGGFLLSNLLKRGENE